MPILVAFAIDLVPNAEIDGARRGDRRHDRADHRDLGDLVAAGDRRRRELVPQRRPHRVAEAGPAQPYERSRRPLPRDRRARPRGARAGDRRRADAEHQALDRRTARTSSHRWETDWSSQTGACQAGLLHGDNHDMPAFRWWEKERGAPIVTNHPKDAVEIERRHSDGRGPAPRRRRQPRQHPLRRRRPLDADDEHGADHGGARSGATTRPTSPVPTRPSRPSTRSSPSTSASAARRSCRSAATSCRGSTGTASTGSSAPGRR